MAIVKTKAGTWEVDIWYRDAEGKLRRQQKTFSKYKDAAAFQDGSRTAVRNREFIAPTNTTLKEIAGQWIKRKEEMRNKNGEQSYRRSTLIQWKNHIDRYIAPSLGAFRVCDIDAQVIEKAGADWSFKVAPQTVNKMLTTLTAVLSLAKRYKLIRDNAGLEAERLKVATDEDETIEVLPDEVYSKEELRKLINATAPGSRERCAVMIPALTGVRVGRHWR